jgi:hypothetical protein
MSAFCFPLSDGGSSDVRSIMVDVGPWGGSSSPLTSTFA